MIGPRSKRGRLLGRRSLPWWRRELSVAERRTIAIGVVAAAITGAAAVVEVGRVWRRGSAPMPSEADDLLQAAQEAVTETVEAAAVGYQEVSTRENAAFNLLTSFVASSVLARGSRCCCGADARSGRFATFGWAGATSTTSCQAS